MPARGAIFAYVREKLGNDSTGPGRSPALPAPHIDI